MKCPKCGLEQPNNPECSGCGIIIARYLARQNGPARSVSAPRGKTRYPGLSLDKEQLKYYDSQATLLRAGLNAVDANRSFLSETGTVRDLSPYHRIESALEDGLPVSEGMGRSPAYFPVHHRKLIAAGEQSGSPDRMFAYLQHTLTQKIRTVEDINQQLRKPKITLLASFFILPLPVIVSDGIIAYLGESLVPLILLVALMLISQLLYRRARTSPSTERSIDKRLLNVPILRQYHINQFLRVFTSLYGAGVNTADAYATATESTSNSYLRLALDSHQPALNAGSSFADTARETGAFGSDVMQIITTGEVAGSLDTALERHLTDADQAFDRDVARLANLLSIGVGLLIGIYVGFRIISAYTALLPPPIAM